MFLISIAIAIVVGSSLEQVRDSHELGPRERAVRGAFVRTLSQARCDPTTTVRDRISAR